MTPLVVGTGFVGQGIIQRLFRDHDVGLTWGQLDDLDGLAALLVKHAPSVVVLAAGSPRHDGFRLDRKTLIEHVMVAERVAAYVREAGTRVVYISSTLALRPTRTNYGILKLLVEHVVGGPKTVILRAGTIIHDLADRNQSVLHKFVHAVVRGAVLPIYDEAEGWTTYLVTRDQLANEVARSLTSSVPREASVVATWQGTVSDLARLVTARWERIHEGHEGDSVLGVYSFDDRAKHAMIPAIDAMLMQARDEGA